jgi:serine phosphatase RsbU (regulator of sigma subunit)
MNKVLHPLLISITCIAGYAFAVKKNTIDSLKMELRRLNSETASIQLLFELNRQDKVITNQRNYLNTALILSKKIGNDSLACLTYLKLKSHFMFQGNRDSAYYFLKKAYHLAKKNNNMYFIGKYYTDMGYLSAVYFNKSGEVYFDSAYTLFQSLYIKNRYFAEPFFNSINMKYDEVIYKIDNNKDSLNKDKKLLFSLKELLQKATRVKDESGVFVYQKHLDIYYYNLFHYHRLSQTPDSALYYAIKNKEFVFNGGNLAVKSFAYSILSIAYLLNHDFKNAIFSAKNGIEIAEKYKLIKELRDNSNVLIEAYKESGDFKNAFNILNKIIKTNDSVNNTSLQNVETNFKKTLETEKLQHEIYAEQAQVTIKNQLLYFSTSIVFLLVILLLFIFRSLRIRNKQNEIITTQKELVDEKNREITDSIKYALRIQTAILPPQKIIKQYLENSFILYKPKDIVAGDFYWMDSVKLKQNGEEIILFAACDCTGHGVPGAMVSVVCHNALNRAVREFGLTQPAAILDKIAEIVLENFSKSEEEIQDGMDISICALNTKTKTLEWSGANNSLLLIINGQLTETKADKQCIGYNDKVKPFTNHQFNLLQGTSIYLFTDGFSDQFGGQSGKKLTKSRFKELLLSIQHLTIQQQALELDKFITNYKKEIEQTDDILVIGVTV